MQKIYKINPLTTTVLDANVHVITCFALFYQPKDANFVESFSFS